MPVPQSLQPHIEYLTVIGADQVAHRNGSLLKHLLGTWQLLNQWSNPEFVCLAGLYHSVYGTGGFEQQTIPLENRDLIRHQIGEQAERMVYLFGACDRPVTHPRIGVDDPLLFHDRFSDEDYPITDLEWRATCEIMLANELDLGRHNHAFYRKHLAHYADLFSRFEPWLGDNAIQARREFERSLA